MRFVERRKAHPTTVFNVKNIYGEEKLSSLVLIYAYLSDAKVDEPYRRLINYKNQIHHTKICKTSSSFTLYIF